MTPGSAASSDGMPESRMTAPGPSSDPPIVPDQRSIEATVMQWQGLVRSIAWQFKQRLPRNTPLEDIVAYGNVGLVESAKRFDPRLGWQFSTYATHRIRGAILDGLAKLSWFNRADFDSRRYVETIDAAPLVESVVESAQDNHPPTSQSSVAEEVTWLKDVGHQIAVVCFSVLAGDGAAVPEIADRRETTESTERAASGDVGRLLRKIVARLAPDARSLIEKLYFENATLTVAAEHLGISKAWASRLHAKTLKRLAFALRELRA